MHTKCTLEAESEKRMKKYHDQVLRNIYKLVVPKDDGDYNDPEIFTELLTSSALPAHCYVTGFKNLNHAYDVCNNEQNTSTRDLYFLSSQFLNFLLTRSYKQHHMPKEFYEFIAKQLIELKNSFHISMLGHATDILTDTIMELEEKYGYKKSYELMQAYESANPMPKNSHGSDWYEDESNNAEYQAYWTKYFAYRKTVRFGAYWTFRRIFENMLSQLMKAVKNNG